MACGVPGPRISWDHSCGNAGSLTHCARLGIKPVSQRSQDTPDHISPQWEHLFFFFRAALQAYESFRARGRIRAAAAGLHHSQSLMRIPATQLMATPDP